jgi:hypothetical protein
MKASGVVGLTLVGLGFFVLFTRGLGGLLNLTYIFVSGIGILAAVLGLNYFNVGRQTERRSAIVDDVEPRYEVPVPGDETDKLLAGAQGLSRASIKRRREFHQRVIDVTHETLAARGDYPSDEAVETAVEDGTWTDDPVAAWFVGETAKPPLSVRWRGMLGSDTEFVFASRRTIAALAEVRGVAPEPEADDGDDTDDEAGGDGATAESSDEAGGTDTTSGTGDAGGDSGGALGGAGDTGGAGGAVGSGTAGGNGRVSDVTTEDATGSENESAWKLTEAKE